MKKEYKIDFSKITTLEELRIIIQIDSLTVFSDHSEFENVKHLLKDY